MQENSDSESVASDVYASLQRVCQFYLTVYNYKIVFLHMQTLPIIVGA